MDVVLRVVIALVLVVGVMWVLAKLARKPMRGRAASTLDVLARAQLSRNAGVAVVRVNDVALVVGVTDGGVSLLRELDAEAFATKADEPERTAVDVEALAAADAPATRPAAGGRTALAGSALSPNTWRQAVEALRERTARGA
jgi:flagellar protein FliO/FliZ